MSFRLRCLQGGRLVSSCRQKERGQTISSDVTLTTSIGLYTTVRVSRVCRVWCPLNLAALSPDAVVDLSLESADQRYYDLVRPGHELRAKDTANTCFSVNPLLPR